MTRTELDKFRTSLTAKRADLAQAAGRRDGIAIERTADALDEVIFAAQRELTTRNLERNAGLLRNVNGALSRIAGGTYGTCLHCEEEIGHKRLNAMPWATLCIACQEEEDAGSHRNAGFERTFLKEAA
jgi:DnaK suppressor protein